MSRDLRFRAWDKKRKRYAKVIQTTNQGWKGYRDKTYITNGIMLFSKWVLSRFIIEQYTGLKDKNGKEIFENDIVFFFTEHYDKTTGGFDGEDEHNATVEWFDNGFAFMDKVPYDPNIECEVIGNIHESPELIGGEE